MPAKSLAQGEFLAETNAQSSETKSPANAIFSETRNAVAALAFAIGMAPAMAGEPANQGLNGTQVAMTGPNIASSERSPVQTDFLAGLDAHLKALAERGIVASDTANGINRDFRKFAEVNPKVYQRPGFEYAIPTIMPFREPYGPLLEKSFERSQSRKLAEIIGTDTVTEDNATEVFRRMFASKKEDGASYEMFVKEMVRLSLDDGFFRTKVGEVDKQAVYEALDRSKSTYTRWQERFGEMRQDGRLARFAQAVNNAIAYAEKKGLTFKPMQVRKGLVYTASCIAAKPEDNPSLYADSCAYTMTWMGERPHPGAIELQFYSPKTGELGFKRIMAPWDAKYAQEVYGPVFADTQAKANDNFWRDYFSLYVGTAEASEAKIRAEESSALMPLVNTLSRLGKMLRSYVEGTPVDGKKVTIEDIQATFDTAKRYKAEIESTVSQMTKERDIYKQTMSGFALMANSAQKIGIK